MVLFLAIFNIFINNSKDGTKVDVMIPNWKRLLLQWGQD